MKHPIMPGSGAPISGPRAAMGKRPMPVGQPVIPPRMQRVVQRIPAPQAVQPRTAGLYSVTAGIPARNGRPFAPPAATQSKVAQCYVIGQATTTTSTTALLAQVRQADNSFRDPADVNHRQIATAGIDPTLANSLRISEDGRMAIEDTNGGGRQAKVFFAEPAIVKKSNDALLKRGSKYLLATRAVGAITVDDQKGKSHKLDAVEPIINPHAPHKSTRKKVASTLGGQAQGLAVRVEGTCTEVAEAIVGRKYGTNTVGNKLVSNVGVSASQLKKLGLLTATEEAQWATAIADVLANHGKPNQGTLDEATVAKAYGEFLHREPVAARKLAKKLGVNTFVTPKVGEAYITEMVGHTSTPGVVNWLQDSTGRTTTDLTVADPTVRTGNRRTGWSNHSGAVVAASGGNTVTLENYARDAEDGTVIPGDATFYFAMYGPVSKPAQTWHQTWTWGAAPIANGVTGLLR